MFENEPQEYTRGWYFPIALIKLYEAGHVNDAELMLLGKINSLCHPEKGCWATNQYLAEWWERDSTWVSATITKFRKLGLVKLQIEDGNRRTIFVTFQGDLPTEKTRSPHRENSVAPPRKLGGQQSNTNQYTNESTGVGTPGAFLLHDEPEDKTPEARLCRRFLKRVVEKHRLHVGKKAPNMRQWKAAARQLLEQFNNDYERIKATIDWYGVHFRDEWVITCHAMTTFAANFIRIQKAMRRDQKERGEPTGHYETKTIWNNGKQINVQEWVDE